MLGPHGWHGAMREPSPALTGAAWCMAQAVNQHGAAPAAAPGALSLEGSHSATKADPDKAVQAQVPMPDLAEDDDEAAAAAAESPDLAAHQEERLRDLVRTPTYCTVLSVCQYLRVHHLPSSAAPGDFTRPGNSVAQVSAAICVCWKTCFAGHTSFDNLLYLQESRADQASSL